MLWKTRNWLILSLFYLCLQFLGVPAYPYDIPIKNAYDLANEGLPFDDFNRCGQRLNYINGLLDKDLRRKYFYKPSESRLNDCHGYWFEPPVRAPSSFSSLEECASQIFTRRAVHRSLRDSIADAQKTFCEATKSCPPPELPPPITPAGTLEECEARLQATLTYGSMLETLFDDLENDAEALSFEYEAVCGPDSGDLEDSLEVAEDGLADFYCEDESDESPLEDCLEELECQHEFVLDIRASIQPVYGDFLDYFQSLCDCLE